MFDWINSLWGWIAAVFKASMDFLQDLPILVLDSVLDALAGVIEEIPVPDFVQGGALGQAFSMLPPEVVFFVSNSGLGAGLAILSAGFTFRMVRKFLTLFQW